MRKSSFPQLSLALALALAFSVPPAMAEGTATAAHSQVVVPAGFSSVGEGHAAAWSLLGDPDLAPLVARAMQANTDLRQALARLEMARARAGATGAAALPQGGLGLARQAGDPSPAPWAGSVALDWEIDLSGRQAKQRRGARARTDEAVANLEAARLAVAAEVARTWFQLRGAREARVLRAQSLAAQSDIEGLTGDLVALGRAAPGDLARSRAESATESALLAQANDRVFALEARLAVLLGETPGAWRAPQPGALAPLHWQPVAVPDPAALLRERPDVRAAGHALAASGEDARAAGAARFPSLSLGGLLGFVAGDLSGLFSSAADERSQGATLSWSLFSLPRLQAQYRESQAGTRLALAVYDQVVLEAIEDTEVALQRHASASEQARLRLEAALQSRVAADAATARYEEGASPYLEALLARRDATAAQLAAVEALVVQRVAVIDVLRALGTPPVAAQQAAATAG